MKWHEAIAQSYERGVMVDMLWSKEAEKALRDFCQLEIATSAGSAYLGPYARKESAGPLIGWNQWCVRLVELKGISHE